MSDPIPPITLFSEPLPNILTQPPETFTLRANATVNEWNFILQQMNDRFVLFNNAMTSFSGLSLSSDVAWAPFVKDANSNTWTQTFNVPNMVAAIDGTSRALTNINATMAANTIAGRAGTAGRIQALTLGTGLTISGTAVLIDVAAVTAASDAVARPVTNLNITAAANTLVGRSGSTGRVQNITLGSGIKMSGTVLVLDAPAVAAEVDAVSRPLSGSGLTLPSETLAGRVSSGPGAVQPLTLGNGLSFSGNSVVINAAQVVGAADEIARPATNVNLQVPAQSLMGRWSEEDGRWQTITIGAGLKFVGTQLQTDNAATNIPALTFMGNPGSSSGPTTPVPISTMVPILDSVPRDVINSGLRTDPGLLGRMEGYGPIERFSLGPGLEMTADGIGRTLDVKGVQQVFAASGSAIRVNPLNPKAPTIGLSAEAEAELAKVRDYIRFIPTIIPGVDGPGEMEMWRDGNRVSFHYYAVDISNISAGSVQFSIPEGFIPRVHTYVTGSPSHNHQTGEFLEGGFVPLLLELDPWGTAQVRIVENLNPGVNLLSAKCGCFSGIYAAK